jgi:hypothetical protein
VVYYDDWDQTENYNLYKPPRGVGAPGSEWDVPVNLNFDMIDALVKDVNDDLSDHIADTSNPHLVRLAQIVAIDDETDVTSIELEQLTDGSNCDSLHRHDTTNYMHSGTHESGGDDEINIGNLQGVSAELYAHEATTTGSHPHSSLTGIGPDDHHAEGHIISSHSDTTTTGAELDELTAGATTALHSHTADRVRANHTGPETLGTNAVIALMDANSCLGNGAIPGGELKTFIANTSITASSAIFLGLKSDCSTALRVADSTAGTGFEVELVASIAGLHPASFWYLIINGA